MKYYHLKKNYGRKIFHFLIVLMFFPILFFIPSSKYFVMISLGGALCIFFLLEFIRFIFLSNFSLSSSSSSSTTSSSNTSSFTSSISSSSTLISFFSLFVTGDEFNKLYFNEKLIILSHISLLISIMLPLYFSSLFNTYFSSQFHLVNSINIIEFMSHFSFLQYLGIFSIGIIDSVTAIFGGLYGKIRWPNSKKTIFGTFSGFIASFLLIYLYYIVYYYFYIEDYKNIALNSYYTFFSRQFSTLSSNITSYFSSSSYKISSNTISSSNSLPSSEQLIHSIILATKQTRMIFYAVYSLFLVLVEALFKDNDNFILPFYSISLFVLFSFYFFYI